MHSWTKVLGKIVPTPCLEHEVHGRRRSHRLQMRYESRVVRETTENWADQYQGASIYADLGGEAVKREIRRGVQGNTRWRWLGTDSYALENRLSHLSRLYPSFFYRTVQTVSDPDARHWFRITRRGKEWNEPLIWLSKWICTNASWSYLSGIGGTDRFK